MKTVINHEVRMAKEILPPTWDFSGEDSILYQMRSLAQKHLSSADFTFEKGKMNLYGPGGFFAEHQDTPTDTSSMVATLVICLPTEFTGGELIVRHRSEETVFDFGAHGGKSQFAMFFSDCLHEVKPVLSGIRMTMTYYLHVGKSQGRHDCRIGYSGVQSTVSVTGSQRNQAAQYQKLLTNMMKISAANFQTGILLNYKYPTNSMRPECLKGCDKLIYECLQESYRSVVLYPVIIKTHEATYVPDYSDEEGHSTAVIYAFTKEHYRYFCRLTDQMKQNQIFSKLNTRTIKILEKKLAKNVPVEPPKKEFSNIKFFSMEVGGHLLKYHQDEGAESTGNEARAGFFGLYLFQYGHDTHLVTPLLVILKYIILHY